MIRVFNFYNDNVYHSAINLFRLYKGFNRFLIHLLHQTEYCTSSPSKVMKKPRMVRNMMALAVITKPQAPPEI